MTLEDRLRTALRAEAGSGTPSSEKWNAIVDTSVEVGRRRARSQRVLVAGVTLTVLGLVAGVLLSRAPEKRQGIVAPPPRSAPARIVTVSKSGALQIRRTSDGHVIKTVKRAIKPGLAPVVASPDGRYVYIDQPIRADCGKQRQMQEINLSTGKTVLVGVGRNPTVSHDGRRLAFVESSDTQHCDVFDTLVIRTLSTGDEKRWPASAKDAGWGITYLHWSVDDTLLSFTLLDTSGFTNHVLDTREHEGARLDGTRALSLPSESQPIGFLAHRRLLLERSAGAGATDLLVTNLDGSNEVQLTQRNAFIDISTVALDRTGTHIMWLERPKDQRDGDSPAKLVRFAIGLKKPVIVAKDILTAAWL